MMRSTPTDDVYECNRRCVRPLKRELDECTDRPGDGKDADWETNPESYEIIEKQVTSDDTLTIVMAKGGGQAVSFMPI